MSNPDLKLDWATYESAKYACENWHYSGSIPPSASVKVGVWEGGRFIGAVVFSRGASPPMYVWAKRELGLEKTEICELVRVALRDHQAPVSRIVTIAIKFLRKKCPGVKVIVSFADASEGHTGGIYQAMNWIYTGKRKGTVSFMINGKKTHMRTVKSFENAKRVDRHAYRIEPSVKHKYLLPLTKDIRKKIMDLAQPYPKRMKQATSGVHSDSDGAAPIHALH